MGISLDESSTRRHSKFTSAFAEHHDQWKVSMAPRYGEIAETGCGARRSGSVSGLVLGQVWNGTGLFPNGSSCPRQGLMSARAGRAQTQEPRGERGPRGVETWDGVCGDSVH